MCHIFGAKFFGHLTFSSTFGLRKHVLFQCFCVYYGCTGARLWLDILPFFTILPYSAVCISLQDSVGDSRLLFYNLLRNTPEVSCSFHQFRCLILNYNSLTEAKTGIIILHRITKIMLQKL